MYKEKRKKISVGFVIIIFICLLVIVISDNTIIDIIMSIFGIFVSDACGSKITELNYKINNKLK